MLVSAQSSLLHNDLNSIYNIVFKFLIYHSFSHSEHPEWYFFPPSLPFFFIRILECLYVWSISLWRFRIVVMHSLHSKVRSPPYCSAVYFSLFSLFVLYAFYLLLPFLYILYTAYRFVFKFDHLYPFFSQLFRFVLSIL